MLENILSLVIAKKADLIGIAVEKPFARNVPEAQQVLDLIDSAGILHGYLENQIFLLSLLKGKNIIWKRAVSIAGRPYLVRYAEEHSGPHSPWFWSGRKQGGGVLSDMLCHSLEAARFLLTNSAEPRSSLKVKTVNAEIASLKWTRKEYIELLKADTNGEIDFAKSAVEDFARATIL